MEEWRVVQQRNYQQQQAEKERLKQQADERERLRIKAQFASQHQRETEQAQVRAGQVEAERLLRERQQTEALQHIAASLKQSDQERYTRLKEAHERIRRLHQGRFWMSRDGRKFMDPQEVLFWEAWNEDTTRKNTMPLIPQHHIAKYRVDFAYASAKIAIEIDGQPHHSRRRDRTRDYERQHTIEDQGWTFVRFTGSQVFADPLACVLYVYNRIHNERA